MQTEEDGGDITFFAAPKAKRRKTSTVPARSDGADPAQLAKAAPALAKGKPIHVAQPSRRFLDDNIQPVTPQLSPADEEEGREPHAAGSAEVNPVKSNTAADASDSALEAGAPEAAAAAAEELPEGTTFRQLGLNEWLDRVCRSLGMAQPTQVQRGCIPAILAGRDVIGTAHTGSGKTAAFALPILQHLAHDPYGIFALVLTPTRELAFQLADQFRALGAGITLKDCVIVGGLDMQQQARELARRPHVVIATPGRLRGLLAADSGMAAGFARAKYLVLDEADRLLEPTFESELRAILQVLPAKRQTLLFSATMTRSLVTLQAGLQNAFNFQAYEGLQTADKLRQEFIFVPAKVKDVYLAHLLEELQELSVRSAIIFCSTCAGCHLLAAILAELGLSCVALHSHKSQKRRLAALHTFKAGGVPILLATDVASRGLDIPTVDLVVNYDLPIAARDYVHRVGRTARAGREGWSLSMITQYDVELVQKIEELTGVTMKSYEMEEGAVLKSITKVFKAKRAASMRIAEEKGFEGVKVGQRANQTKNKKRQPALVQEVN